MDLRAAELLLANVLPGHRLYERGPAERETTDALDHRYAVSEAWDVRRSRGSRADHRGDLRNHSAHDDLFAEQVPRAGEERNHVRVTRPGVDAGAGRVDQPYDRPAPLERHRPQSGDLLFACVADAAPLDREVVRRGTNHPAVDLAERGHHGVRRRLVPSVRAGGKTHLGAVRPDLELH